MQERRGLLLVTRNLPPLRGGMERLNARLAAEMSRTMDVTVVGPHGSGVLAVPGVEVIACPRPGLAAFLVWSMWTAGRVARRRRPRWILGGSGLAAPAVLWASVISGARRAVYLHGLDVVARHPLYRAVWLPAIRRMHALIANSRNTAALARYAGVEAGRLDVVVPGVEPPLPPDPQAGFDFRTRHGLGHRKILLSVGRLTERKGLTRFVEQSLPLILARQPRGLLLVVGDAAPNALLQGGHDLRSQVDAVIARRDLADSVRFLGPISEEELHAAYEASDLHVFPVVDRPGDVEGFGMVAIEAAAHGRSTVAFAVGGVPDAVREGESGYLIAQGDYAAFAGKVCDALERGPDAFAESARKFALGLSWERFGLEIARALARHEGAP
jgi:phosphatidylinositol alpha-1,6-mannosyltransferase